jgi:formate dehydrogenase subunit gamma
MHSDKIIALTDRELSRVRSFLGKDADAQTVLLPLLHAVQEEFGYIVPEALPVIAEELNISQAEVRGVVSFYHDFRLEPPGRHVLKLCRAEACQSMGGERLAAHAASQHALQPGQTTPGSGLTIENVHCLGNCALAPAAMLDDRLIGRMDESKLDAIVAGARK